MENKLDIRWVFFDIGDVLVSTEGYNKSRNEMTFQTIKEYKNDLTLDEFNAAYKQLAPSFPASNSKKMELLIKELLPRLDGEEISKRIKAISKVLEEAMSVRVEDYLAPYQDVIETLDYLKPRYKLGIIANFSQWIKDGLKNWGLYDYFEVIVLSSDIGISKPDKKIFTYALEKANATPRLSCMIGDRPDNDIAPAKALGMHTIRVAYKGTENSADNPKTDAEIAEFQIDSLNALKSIL